MDKRLTSPEYKPSSEVAEIILSGLHEDKLGLAGLHRAMSNEFPELLASVQPKDRAVEQVSDQAATSNPPVYSREVADLAVERARQAAELARQAAGDYHEAV